MKRVMLCALAFACVLSASASAKGGEQEAARQKLAARSASPVSVQTDQRTGVPTFVTMKIAAAKAGDASASALAFLDEYKDLFLMRAPSEELRVRNVKTDALGTSHVRIDQTVQGVRVFGAEMIVHLNAENQIYAFNGTYIPDLTLATVQPSIDAQTAIDLAIKNVGKATFRWNTALENMLPDGQSWKPTAELLVYIDGSTPHLAWRTLIAVEDPDPANWVYFIDALTGEVVHRYNDLKDADAIGTGNTLYRGPVSIHTNSISGGYELKDVTRNIWTYNAGNKSSLPGSMMTDADNIWGTGNKSNAQSAATDAHWGCATTYDYYSGTFSRNSLDGLGMRITASTHYKVNYVNAFWNGQQIVFGDGDGVQADPLVDIDVVSHELTHGVTQYEANLTYSNQSGALNESVSDIFAMMVDTRNFTIGEDCWTPGTSGDALRYMYDPTLGGQPKNMSGYVNTTSDNGGVHTNSGIPNYAAYLMVAGSGLTTPAVTGIGRDKAGAIWYRALTTYMTASTDFAGARATTITAAGDLFGSTSAEAQTVANAWSAVGVLAPAPPPPSWNGVLVAHSWSTPHPYRNNKTYTHTITQSGALGMKVDFANFNTELNYDFVSIKNATGATVAKYSGNLGTFTSAPVTGSSITVQLVTDQSVNAYGFDITGYRYTDASHPMVYMPLPAWTHISDDSEAKADNGATQWQASKIPVAFHGVPDEIVLEQNYPNPFNPTTVISFSIPESQNVRLEVFNSMGQLVRTLVSGNLPAGLQSVIWDATDAAGNRAASGLYIYRLSTASGTQSRSMMLMQ